MLMAFKNQWQVAIADYSKAIAINPNDFNFYYNRGMVYGKTNQFEKASEDFTRVLQLNPQNKSAYSLREMANAELTAKMGQ
jgi:tetratricopeptide (TPR) repeat protein